MARTKKLAAALMAVAMLVCSVPAFAANDADLLGGNAASATDLVVAAPTSDTDAKTSDSDAKVSDSDAKTSDSDVKADDKKTSDSDVATSDSDAKTSDSDVATSDSDAKTSDTDVTPDDKDTSASDVITGLDRLDGADRYLTANKIAREGWKQADVVVLASGESYPDALAGAAFAKKNNAPILLTGKDQINPFTQDLIQELGAKKVVILGGTAAVSQKVEDIIKADKTDVERIAGENRNDTAARIAANIVDKCDRAFLVSNANFADALSISSVAAIEGAPVLYVNPDGTLPKETADALKDFGTKEVYIIGGPAAIKEAAEKALTDLSIKSERVYGDDRYATSDVVYNKFASDFSKDAICIATGKNYPDALAGAAFAASKNLPVMLLGDELTDAMKTAPKTGVYIFGGENAISKDLEAQMKRAFE